MICLKFCKRKKIHKTLLQKNVLLYKFDVRFDTFFGLLNFNFQNCIKFEVFKMMETFVTTQKREYKWPYPKAITFRPAQPKLVTKGKNFYMVRPFAAYCHCDTHQYDSELTQYTQLAEKELQLLDELYKLNTQQVGLSNGVLDHPCDNDDVKMESVYQTDYKKRGLALSTYRKMMADVDSKAPNPIKPPMIGLVQAYRDPTMFRYTALQRPTINPCPPVTWKMTPETVKSWFMPGTGRTEYMDTISKNGLATMKARQQYTEPLPSTRRRFGDPCV